MTRRGWVLVLVLGLLAGGPAAFAQLGPEGLETIRHLAIQHNGRHKPFDSFARETLHQVTGASRIGREDPVQTIVSILANPEQWQERPLIAIPFRPLRKALGLAPETTHVSHSELIATRTLMRALPAIVEKQQRDEKLSMLEQETMDAFNRFVAFSRLVEHRLELVPSRSLTQRAWLPILTPAGYPPDAQARLRALWTDWITALRSGSESASDAATSALAVALQEAHPPAYPADWRLRLEVLYNRLGPFHVARLLYAVAALGLLLSFAASRRWAHRVGMLALWAATLLHGAGMVLRVVLGERPPVSNFYETMLWLPFVAVVLALIFERIYRVRYFAIAASILAAITLVLADHLPLDPSISPVVAVLRSTLWLTIHVLTIVASYGALALATVLAHIYGILYLTRHGQHPSLPSLDTFIYRAIQVGVVLLAGGIMLGAVWANASWGRYWGWDPKETWALITLLWFLAVLHGRFAGWLHGIGVALSTIGGFFLLLMTYYGVSFYLVGLHSYAGGNAKPLPALLIAYLIAEIAFMLAVGLTASRRTHRLS